MNRIVECVPNFSEGRNQRIINELTSVFESEANVFLLQVDAGCSTNRTVFTLVGEPDALIRVMLKACKIAFDLIDMRTHQGEHKRLGALDVCPFVPVRNVTMEDCVQLANRFGEELAKQLHVPVYLYGEAARCSSRRQVPSIREGEYEKLSDRIQTKEWRPDFGPAEFVPSWGASIVGARQFLIAYNVNLLCTRNQANTIAFNIRESGRPEKQQVGRLAHVQAMGWTLDEAKLSQVTANILDHHTTPLYRVWDEVCADASQMNIPVFGSEIVGVVPLDALLAVADHIINNEHLFVLGEEAKIRLVVHRLGLSYLSEFRPEDRVIEYILRKRFKEQKQQSAVNTESESSLLFNLEGLRGLQLCAASVERFVETVANREPVPGGGSVSALIGSLGAALAVMVGRLSSGCAAFAHNEVAVRHLLPSLYDTCEQLLELVDKDSQAFADLMQANRTKYASEADKQAAILQATRTCVEVPLSLANRLDSLWVNLIKLNHIKNSNTSSDLLVAGYSFYAAIQGALANVEINLTPALGSAYNEQIKDQVNRVRTNAKQAAEQLKLIL